VLTYNWVLALVSLLVFIAHRWPRPIEWSYYPLYLVIGWLLKSFLYRRIPDAVDDLHRSGAVPDREYSPLLARLDRALNDAWGVVSFGLAGALLIVAFYWRAFGCSWSWSVCRLWWIGVAVDIVYGFAVGAAAWKATSLAHQVRAWGTGGHLIVRPFHPDGAAGLAAIGRLFLSLSRVLAAGGLFCAVWLLLAMLNRRTGTFAMRLTQGVDDFLPGLIGGLLAVTAIGVAAFVVPMLTVHGLMADKAQDARAERDMLAVAIADLEGALVSGGTHLTPERVEPQLRQLRALRDVYGQRQRIPTWPVEPGTSSRFAGTWILPVLASVTFVEQGVGTAEKLAARVKEALPWVMKWVLP
jgi:hypothetical protein